MKLSAMGALLVSGALYVTPVPAERGIVINCPDLVTATKTQLTELEKVSSALGATLDDTLKSFSQGKYIKFAGLYQTSMQLQIDYSFQERFYLDLLG